MKKHTPLTIVGITETTIVNKDGAIIYDAADYDVLDFNDAQSTCKGIARAVNNHEQLVKALEPFAKLGEELTDLKSSEHWTDDRVIFAYNNVPLTFGDVKTAFNLLSQLESK